MNEMTPAEARERLGYADRPALSTSKDQRLHGLALAGMAVLFGVGIALSRGLPSPAGTVVPIVEVLLLIALLVWVRRASRARPRKVNTVMVWAVLATYVCSMTSQMTMNYIYREDPWSVQALLITGAATAFPLLVAAHRVFWGGWMPNSGGQA